MKNAPYIIVLILSYNGKHLLKDSVSSYLNNEYSNFNVLVIDNGSTDGTKEYVEKNFPKASVIRLEENRGYSGGFNWGIDYAINEKNADYVLVSNNDVLADIKVISELVTIANSDSKVGFVVGKSYFYNQPNVLQSVGRNSHPISIAGEFVGVAEEDVGQYDKIKEYPFCDDVFLLVSKQVIRDVGSYDPDFFFMYEITDWCFRIRKKGYKIVYTPNAKVWHKVGGTEGGRKNPINKYHINRSEIIFMKKNASDFFFGLFLTKSFSINLVKGILAYLVQARLDLVMAIIKGKISGLIWILRNSN